MISSSNDIILSSVDDISRTMTVSPAAAYSPSVSSISRISPADSGLYVFFSDETIGADALRLLEISPTATTAVFFTIVGPVSPSAPIKSGRKTIPAATRTIIINETIASLMTFLFLFLETGALSFDTIYSSVIIFSDTTKILSLNSVSYAMAGCYLCHVS